MTTKDSDAHDMPASGMSHPRPPQGGWSPMSLDEALHLLQADPGHSLADPGLARLGPIGLERLFLAARHQAERNHDGILLLLDLMHLIQRAEGNRRRRLMRAVIRQLRLHMADQHRWQALADNAAYYRDNRQVAERVAERLRSD